MYCEVLKAFSIVENTHKYFFHEARFFILFRMIGVMLTCAIEHYDGRVPRDVSLTLRPCDVPTNLLKVENDQLNYKGPRHHITACLGQIYNGFNDVNQLVEMVEVNRILGVDLVVLYNHTSSAILDPYIHSFQKDAVLDFYNWYHPLTQKVGNRPFFGNFILNNDCLYRYMYRSDYIIMADLDELMVPDERYGTLPVLLSQIAQPNISQYTISRVCFPDDWPSRIGRNNIIQDYHIRTILHTKRRDDKIQLQKPKSILKPEYISVAENHNLSQALYGGAKTVSPSQIKIFHYRNTDRHRKHNETEINEVTDLSMHRFDDIVKRVILRHTKVRKHKERLGRKGPIPHVGLT